MNCLLTRQPPLTRILMTARMAGPKSFLNLQHRTRSAAMIQLPPLPFAKDALSPHLSAETIEYHYGKHHQAYVNNLNQLIPGTKYENLPIEDIVRSSEGKIFNNAAQVWNHTFYWNCLSPNAAGSAAGAPLHGIRVAVGGFEACQKNFTRTPG